MFFNLILFYGCKNCQILDFVQKIKEKSLIGPK